MSAGGEALENLARIEGLSRSLRRAAGEPARLLLAGDRAVRPELQGGPLPFRVDPGVWARTPVGPALRADAVLVSSMPTRDVGFRAFYLDSRLTLAAGSAPLLRRSTLLRGSRVAQRFAGVGAVAVPVQYERVRRLRLAWVVEQLLPGHRARRADWSSTVAEVIDAVASLWQRADPVRVPVRGVVPWLSGRRVSELLQAMEVDPDRPTKLSAAIDRLAADTRPLLVGWTHGDPVPNNVLRLADGRIGLVDWERAGRNPLGLDLGRALAALDDPGAAITYIEGTAGRFGAAGALPLHLQAAAAVIGLMPTWAAQRDAWQRADRARGYAIRNRRRVALLERLFDA